jgi:hypothetical protein
MSLYNVKSKMNTIATNDAIKLLEWTANGYHKSGDLRLLYATLDLRGTGGNGECLRPRTRVYGTGVNSAHGEHCTLQIAAGGAISGLGAGLRATLEAAAETRTLTGTLCALQVDSNIGANNTMPASSSFIRIADNGSVKINHLFELPTIGNGLLIAAHVTDAMTHSIKCRDAAGTVFYIMATTTSTNRS